VKLLSPAQLIVCEVCGSFFDSRRGLANHARVHLRQLGVSEPGTAPIDLLYQLIKERDGAFSSFKAHPGVSDFSPARQRSHRGASPLCEEEGSPFTAGHRVSTTPQGTSLLPLSASALKMVESRLSDSGSSCTLETLTKPLWAPLETDAPITLGYLRIKVDTADEHIHVCHLCGCWCETRKGLSSHARSHLRQLGIPDGDGNPIETLYQLMEEEDLKPINPEANPPPQSSPLAKAAKRPAEVSSPTTSTPNKQPKKGHFACVLCGEAFENHKGLAIHSRYHLRHFGVTDLLGKESSIEAIQELVESGVLKPTPKANSTAASSSAPSQTLSPVSSKSPSMPKSGPKAKKGFRFAVDPFFRKPKPEATERSITDVGNMLSFPSLDTDKPPTVPCDYCGQLFETRKALSCHVRCHLRALGIALPMNTSPIELLREVMAQTGAVGTPAVSQKTQVPKRSMDIPSTTVLSFLVLDAACELCGFEFDNRKALASHARAHLRQLGIEWKPDGSGSPIDLLSDIIRKDPAKVAEVMQRYRMGDLYIRKVRRPSSPSVSTDSDSVQGSVKEKVTVTSSFKQSHLQAVDPGAHAPKGFLNSFFCLLLRQRMNINIMLYLYFVIAVVHAPKQPAAVVEAIQDSSSQPAARPGSIPAMLPKPPLTPLVKVVGKVYSLKCRFCEEVFHGPLSVQEKWITHLQKHIRTLGYKGKASPPLPR
uniref:Si:dkey-217d24.6 n=1 Tax=Neogobius melanostomus TaxID=47308 RepID=A0A8C6SDL0_9GOBI